MQFIKKHYLLIIFIIIQTIAYIVAGIYKENLHLDEIYSFGLTHYDKIEIQDNEDFYNNWHTKEYYKEYLTVNKDEIWNFKPVYENQKNDVHPPLYYLLLRIAMSFSIGEFSKWTGIGLNIIIYIFVTIFMYLILKKLFKNDENSDKKASVLSFMSSMTLASVSNVIYIRMYALLTLIILITIFLHIKLLERNNASFKLLLGIGITVLAGILTHYYYVIFLAVLYIIFAVKYIREKKTKLLINYTLTMVASGILSLVIFPYSINHIFFGYRGEGVVSNLKNANKILPNLWEQIRNLNYYAFNKTIIIFVIAIIVILIYNKIYRKRINKINKEQKEILKIIGIPAIIFFIFSAIASPWQVLRYFVPVCGLIFVLVFYILYKLLQTKFSEKTSNLIIVIIFCIMLITPFTLNLKPELMYLDQKEIIQKLSKEMNAPTIYFLSSENAAFINNIYIFTKIDESYITKDIECTEKTINQILEGKDLSKGIIVFIGKEQENEEILNKIKNITNLENSEYLTELYSSKVYYIN